MRGLKHATAKNNKDVQEIGRIFLRCCQFVFSRQNEDFIFRNLIYFAINRFIIMNHRTEYIYIYIINIAIF